MALLITLGAAVAVYTLYNRYFVERPFKEEISRLPGVQGVVLARDEHKVTVTVSMGDMEDFAPTYRGIEQLAEQRFGKEGYSIKIKDRRNEELQEFYGELQLYLYEGIANNSFLWLDKEIGRLAGQRGLGYKVSVDEENLYLQLHDKRNYLYEVIRRKESGSINQGLGR